MYGSEQGTYWGLDGEGEENCAAQLGFLRGQAQLPVLFTDRDTGSRVRRRKAPGALVPRHLEWGCLLGSWSKQAVTLRRGPRLILHRRWRPKSRDARSSKKRRVYIGLLVGLPERYKLNINRKGHYLTFSVLDMIIYSSHGPSSLWHLVFFHLHYFCKYTSLYLQKCLRNEIVQWHDWEPGDGMSVGVSPWQTRSSQGFAMPHPRTVTRRPAQSRQYVHRDGACHSSVNGRAEGPVRICYGFILRCFKQI